MTPPDTNTTTQERRHRPALIGIAIAVLLGGLFFGLNMLTAVDEERVEDIPEGYEGDVSVEGSVTEGAPDQ